MNKNKILICIGKDIKKIIDTKKLLDPKGWYMKDLNNSKEWLHIPLIEGFEMYCDSGPKSNIRNCAWNINQDGLWINTKKYETMEDLINDLNKIMYDVSCYSNNEPLRFKKYKIQYCEEIFDLIYDEDNDTISTNKLKELQQFIEDNKNVLEQSIKIN